MQKITFPGRTGFHRELKKRVDAYFAERDISKNANWQMYLKTALILALVITSYVMLVFFTTNLTMAAVWSFALAQGFVLVGFNIMHDGNHGSYSRSRAVNKIMGFTSDIIGGSSMLWQQKHNILHHTYTNIDELDDDIHSNGLLRLSPEQKWRPWHRFQHIYAFPLYSLLSLSWMLYADFRKFFSGRIGDYELRKPTKSETTTFFLAKAIYFGYMLVLPMFFHPIAYVILAYVGVHLILGLTLSIVFQLAHTVEGNTFPVPDPANGTIENEWAIHQVETTANFAPRNKLACWYLGGLNFQIEHHLFAKVCHVHYPEISKIVKKTCEDFSINYVSYPSVWKAIIVHLRFLRNLGTAPS